MPSAGPQCPARDVRGPAYERGQHAARPEEHADHTSDPGAQELRPLPALGPHRGTVALRAAGLAFGVFAQSCSRRQFIPTEQSVPGRGTSIIPIL